jgi:hypothetical protein
MKGRLNSKKQVGDHPIETSINVYPLILMTSQDESINGQKVDGKEGNNKITPFEAKEVREEFEIKIEGIPYALKYQGTRGKTSH